MLAKTVKGREELNDRRYHLPTSLRPVLIMVDGKTSLNNLLRAGGGIPDFFESLMTLCDQGFIAPDGHPVPTSNSQGENRHNNQPALNTSLEADSKDKLIRLASILLGAQAKGVIKKIEDSVNNKEALEASVNGCFKLIKFAIDEKKADEFLHAAKDILVNWK